MIAGQIDAMAYVMEDCMEADRLCDDKERWLLAKIRFHLREVGLRVWNLHFTGGKTEPVGSLWNWRRAPVSA